MDQLSRADQIQSILVELKQPKFRLQQILTAIYQDNILDYSQMFNLPLRLRNRLKKQLGEVLTLKVLKTSDGTMAKKIPLSVFLPSPAATWAASFVPLEPWA